MQTPDGRSVYQHAGGAYLYFVDAAINFPSCPTCMSSWAIGTDYTDASLQPDLFSVSSAPCPTGAMDWLARTGSGYAVLGTLACPSPPPSPLSPSLPPLFMLPPLLPPSTPCAPTPMQLTRPAFAGDTHISVSHHRCGLDVGDTFILGSEILAVTALGGYGLRRSLSAMAPRSLSEWDVTVSFTPALTSSYLAGLAESLTPLAPPPMVGLGSPPAISPPAPAPPTPWSPLGDVLTPLGIGVTTSGAIPVWQLALAICLPTAILCAALLLARRLRVCSWRRKTPPTASSAPMVGFITHSSRASSRFAGGVGVDDEDYEHLSIVSNEYAREGDVSTASVKPRIGRVALVRSGGAVRQAAVADRDSGGMISRI